MGWKYLGIWIKYLDFTKVYRYEKLNTSPDLARVLEGLHGVGKEITSKWPRRWAILSSKWEKGSGYLAGLDVQGNLEDQLVVFSGGQACIDE